MLARTLLAAAALLLLAPRPASACSKRHETPFELYDRSARVAEVRVTSTPGPRQAGRAQLRVLRTLKGSPRATLQGEETNSTCRVGYRTGSPRSSSSSLARSIGMRTVPAFRSIQS